MAEILRAVTTVLVALILSLRCLCLRRADTPSKHACSVPSGAAKCEINEDGARRAIFEPKTQVKLNLLCIALGFFHGICRVVRQRLSQEHGCKVLCSTIIATEKDSRSAVQLPRTLLRKKRHECTNDIAVWQTGRTHAQNVWALLIWNEVGLDQGVHCQDFLQHYDVPFRALSRDSH